MPPADQFPIEVSAQLDRALPSPGVGAVLPLRIEVERVDVRGTEPEQPADFSSDPPILAVLRQHGGPGPGPRACGPSRSRNDKLAMTAADRSQIRSWLASPACSAAAALVASADASQYCAIKVTSPGSKCSGSWLATRSRNTARAGTDRLSGGAIGGMGGRGATRSKSRSARDLRGTAENLPSFLSICTQSLNPFNAVSTRPANTQGVWIMGLAD